MVRRLCALGAAIILIWTLAAAAPAQTVPALDGWEALSERAQSLLEGDPTVDELEALRVQLSERREDFLQAQDVNAARIATVQAQLDALGPLPAEGEEPEPEEVAERRATLNAEMARYRAPVLRAEEAFTEAQGLIAQIDGTVRDRYAQQLLSRGPSPLNPTYWIGGWYFLLDIWDALVLPPVSNWADTDARADALNAAPIVIAMLLVSVPLIVRSRWWIRLFAGWAVRQSRRGRGVLYFGLSLGQLVLPIMGFVLLSRALLLTDLWTGSGAEMIAALPVVALPAIAAKWLSTLLLASEDGVHPFFADLDRWALKLRRVILAMGYALSTILAVKVVAAIHDRDDIPVEVLLFLPHLLLAALLLRIGQLFTRAGRAAELPHAASETTETVDPSARKTFGSTVLRVLGRVSIIAGIVGILAAALGYANAADAILVPMARTLAVVALVGLLQTLVADLYALLTGTKEGEREALIPLLIGFGLACAALPVFALIWGARVSDLTEVWTRFRAGFAVGGMRIAPTDLLTFMMIFAIVFALTRFVQGILRNSVLPKTRMDVGGRNAIVSGVGYVGIFLAVLMAVTGMGVDLTSLAVVAGALSVGIGFGLQNVVSNFVSGIILLIERPISEGDWIQVGDQMGYVRDISVRSTRIETFDRTDVIVPNADLVSNSVINWTRGNNTGRVIVPVGVAYGTDTERVAQVLREVAEANPMVVLNPPPNVLFRAFGASSLDFEIRAILRDVNFVVHVQSELLHAIAKRFAEEGIEIPFPQQDVWLRNPETLSRPTESPG